MTTFNLNLQISCLFTHLKEKVNITIQFFTTYKKYIKLFKCHYKRLQKCKHLK